jgi:hypothetical protein
MVVPIESSVANIQGYYAKGIRAMNSDEKTVNLADMGLADVGNKLWEEMEAQLRVEAQKKVERDKNKVEKKKVIKVRRLEAKEEAAQKVRLAARKASADRLASLRSKRTNANDIVEKNLLPLLAQAMTQYIEQHGKSNTKIVLNLGDRDGYHGFSIFLQNAGTDRKFAKNHVMDLAKQQAALENSGNGNGSGSDNGQADQAD